MTTIMFCLLFAVLLPYLVRMAVTSEMQKAGGYDNHYPREQQARLTGFGARAVGAQQNCFESLLIFSVSMFSALITNHLSFSIQILALVYCLSRIVYVFCYLYDYAAQRSLFWLIGFLACLIILCSSFF